MPTSTVEQSSDTITDTQVVDTPGADKETVTVEAEASLLSEYVSALDTAYKPWQRDRYIRQLPVPMDELQRDFGSRLYDVDMPQDAQVYSTMSILCMAILAQGLKLRNPIRREATGYEQAERIRKFNQYCLDNLTHPLGQVLYELTDGMLKMGHKTAEQIYETRPVALEGFSLPQAMVLSDIKTKAHEATAFVVDAYNNVLGLMYVHPGKPLPRLGPHSSISGGDLLTEEELEGKDETGLPILIPRSKFFIPTHKPRNGDPRGTSHLRAVYTAWWKKQQWNPQHLAYVTRFAQPSAVANLGKDAKDIPILDPATGQPTCKKSIITQTIEALVKIKGGAVGAFIDTEVDLLEAASDGKVIFDSYAHENREMAKAILMQTLTTEESQYMARAASAVHQDVFGLLVTYLRSIVEDALEQDVLYWLTRYNFGEEAAETMTPVASLGRVQVQDVPSMMASVAQVANAGGVIDKQWPMFHDDWGTPNPSPEEWQEHWDKLEEDRQLMQKAALAPPTAPGSPASPSAGKPGFPAKRPAEDGRSGPDSDGKARPSREPTKPRG